MSITTVLLDLGGVIVDSPLDGFDTYEREAGLPAGIIRRVNLTDPDANAWARFERGELDPDGFVTAFEAEAAALGTTLDARRVLAALSPRVRPEMVEAVRTLQAAGLRLGLLTNNVSPMPREGELGKLLALFDAVVESSVEGVRKPEQAFYELALSRLGDPGPAECVFLDDLGVNLKPARAMGISTIKVGDTGPALARLSELTGVALEGASPDRVLPSHAGAADRSVTREQRTDGTMAR